jgi:hypothetical protein
MLRRSAVLVGMVLLLLTAVVAAQTTVPLVAAHGQIDKVGKESITVRPRGADGKFEKAVVLKFTGTSKLTTLAPRMSAGKVVVTQKDTDLKDLHTKQNIAVIYTTVKGGHVLLSGVVQPSK